MGRKHHVLVLEVLAVILVVFNGCSLEPAEYTVDFESNGGSPVSSITRLRSGDRITEPEAPSRIGYAFSGWYKEPGLVTLWDFETDTISSNHTLYAKWTALYTVTFDAQGGKAPSPASIDVTLGSNYGDLAETTRDGYEFLHWNTAPDGSGTEVTSGTPVETAADHTLYARWAMGPRPFAVDDSYEVSINSGPTVFTVLVNDLNCYNHTGGANLEIVSLTTPTPMGSGAAWFSGNATTITFQPSAEYAGQATFTYRIVDTLYPGDGESTATVTVRIQ